MFKVGELVRGGNGKYYRIRDNKGKGRWRYTIAYNHYSEDNWLQRLSLLEQSLLGAAEEP